MQFNLLKSYIDSINFIKYFLNIFEYISCYLDFNKYENIFSFHELIKRIEHTFF